jgi:hypothetical protein
MWFLSAITVFGGTTVMFWDNSTDLRVGPDGLTGATGLGAGAALWVGLCTGVAVGLVVELYLGKVEAMGAVLVVEVAVVLDVEGPEVELYFGNDEAEAVVVGAEAEAVVVGAEAVEVGALVVDEELYFGKVGAVWVLALPEAVGEELVEELMLDPDVAPEVVGVDPDVGAVLAVELEVDPELDEVDPKADLAPTVPVGLEVVGVEVPEVDWRFLDGDEFLVDDCGDQGPTGPGALLEDSELYSSLDPLHVPAGIPFPVYPFCESLLVSYSMVGLTTAGFFSGFIGTLG